MFSGEKGAFFSPDWEVFARFLCSTAGECCYTPRQPEPEGSFMIMQAAQMRIVADATVSVCAWWWNGES